MGTIGKMIIKFSNSAVLFWVLALVFSTMTASTWVATGEFVVGWAAPAFSMLVVALVFTIMPSRQADESTTKMDRDA